MPAADAPFISLAQLVRAGPPLPAGVATERQAARAMPAAAVEAALETPAAAPATADSAPTIDSALTAPTASSALPPAPLAERALEHFEDAGESGGTEEALREARLFRAALADALDSLTARLAHDLAHEVFGRELALGADLEMIARRLVADCWADEPLRLRVAAADAGIACELPVQVDPALRAGDAVLECRAGAIDARLTIRLARLAEGRR